MNNRKTLIPSESKWKYLNLNPTAYKLAQLFAHKIKQVAPLPNTHILENTIDLLKKLENTILPHFTLASLEFSNLNTNTAVKETREIIANNLDNNKIEPQAKHELLNWYDIITNQNYFSNNGKILIQQEGLAIGAATFGIIAEFFLQHLEDTHLTHLSKKHKIAAYFCCVGDILLIYDSHHTDISNIQNDFNEIHPNIMFTAETESNNNINYLNITIHRTHTNWVTSIHRNPPSQTHPSCILQTTQPNINMQQ
jgi:hypothetical protein